jgi:hypothetical protein
MALTPAIEQFLAQDRSEATSLAASFAMLRAALQPQKSIEKRH